jgi:hypothetical protein
MNISGAKAPWLQDSLSLPVNICYKNLCMKHFANVYSGSFFFKQEAGTSHISGALFSEISNDEG